MIERADQLVLDYLSKVAELSHSTLRPEERLDFMKRLRARIDELRGGSESMQETRKVIERFGDPLALVEREAEKLKAGRAHAAPANSTPSPVSADHAPNVGAEDPREPLGEDDLDTQVIATEPRRSSGGGRLPGQGLPGSGLPGTQWVPPRMGRETPGVVEALQAVQATVNRSGNADRGSAPPPDARVLFDTHRNGLMAIGMLILAAILAPVPLPLLAIFPIWLILWAAGAAATLMYGGWPFRDRLVGALTPPAVLVVASLAIGVVDASQTSLTDLRAYTQAFSDAGPVMFIIGTVLGVAILVWKLIRPSRPARAGYWPRRW